MAIFSAVPPPSSLTNHPQPQPDQAPPSSQQSAPLDIEAWTISALQSLSVSPVARGTGTPLSIPLDDHVVRTERAKTPKSKPDADPLVALPSGERVLPPRRPPSARDSLKKRDALQKGKEGSRQRRRWENDRLVGVPNAQPPLPIDCVPRPTHPVNHIPYHVAHYWDKSVRQLVEDKTVRLQVARKKQQLQNGSATGLGIGEVPRDLRESTKRSATIKGWVRLLEEPVRSFLVEQYQPKAPPPKQEVESRDGDESSDGEEMLFAGRKGMKNKSDGQWKKARKEVKNGVVETGMVFESFGDDESASFKRWLTHSISDYYGLESRSVTTGNPARRVVYVGVKTLSKRKATKLWSELPRPLWEVC